MELMNLPEPLSSGKSYTEEVPEGTIEQQAASFGADFGSKVLNIKIKGSWDNLREAIKYIVGYSETVSSVGGQPFNPYNAAVQGPYYLRRIDPARHPHFKGMRATKILGVTGKGISKDHPVTRHAAGTTGTYEFIYISILFEIPKFPYFSDREILDDISSRGYGAVGLPIPEYLRYSLYEFEPNVETLARKGVTWYLPNSSANSVSRFFTGDRFARTAKGVLKITTYDVHEDYVKLGRLYPKNHFNRTSKLNSRPFPRYGFRDQNTGTLLDNIVRFDTGTLLLLPTKVTPHAQCHPAVMTGAVHLSYFPRTVDVETNMVYFDPETDDETFIDLSDVSKYGEDWTLTASATKVRGHNLVPLPKPINSGPTGYLWYTAVNNAVNWSASQIYATTGPNTAAVYNGRYYRYINVAPSAGNLPTDPVYWTEGIANDKSLLYEYADFEKLWAPVEQ